MAKLIDIILKRNTFGSYETMTGLVCDSFICDTAVKTTIKTNPKHIRLKIFNKNPKRKNTLYVQRPKGYPNLWLWRGRVTSAYTQLEQIVKYDNEFWITIERISSAEAKKLSNRVKK